MESWGLVGRVYSLALEAQGVALELTELLILALADLQDLRRASSSSIYEKAFAPVLLCVRIGIGARYCLCHR
jgi:hypothetical protein